MTAGFVTVVGGCVTVVGGVVTVVGGAVVVVGGAVVATGGVVDQHAPKPLARLAAGETVVDVLVASHGAGAAATSRGIQ